MLPLQAPEIYPKTQQAKSNRVPKFKQRPFVTKCQQPKLSRPSFLLLLLLWLLPLLPLLSLLSLLPLLPLLPAIAPPKRTKIPILCSKCPKMRIPKAKKAQKPRFCARNARKRRFRRAKKHKNLDFVLGKPENEGFGGKKRTKIPILCSGGRGLAPGREEISIGKHNMSLPANHLPRFQNVNT